MPILNPAFFSQLFVPGPFSRPLAKIPYPALVVAPYLNLLDRNLVPYALIRALRFTHLSVPSCPKLVVSFLTPCTGTFAWRLVPAR